MSSRPPADAVMSAFKEYKTPFQNRPHNRGQCQDFVSYRIELALLMNSHHAMARSDRGPYDSTWRTQN
jgi:hypothetical protein